VKIPHRDSRQSLNDLESRIARQDLYIQTLLRLLLEKGIIQKEEFGEWLDYVDSLDGRTDGRLSPSSGSKSCKRCRRVNPIHARLCQYCDALFPSSEFLDYDGA
jgi:hypothetical protein